MSNVEERKELQKLLSCINKKLVTDRTQCPTGEKDRLKSLIHQELQNSGVRTELESKARTLIQEAGGVDQVDVEQLVHQLISKGIDPGSGANQEVNRIKSTLIRNITAYLTDPAVQNNNSSGNP